MKTLWLVILLSVAIPAWAQEETLVGGEVQSGGFGGPVLKISRIKKDEMAIFVGGRGGWIINHVFVLGGAGYGLVNNMKVRQTGDTSHFLMMGYGGLELEYINDSDRLIHYTIRALIGAGGSICAQETPIMDSGREMLFSSLSLEWTSC